MTPKSLLQPVLTGGSLTCGNLSMTCIRYAVSSATGFPDKSAHANFAESCCTEVSLGDSLTELVKRSEYGELL